MGPIGVALGGFMGVGKSSVGMVVAQELGLEFCDMDATLSARFGPIATQFEQFGEATFRERESELLGELCRGEPCVLATGGGAWLSQQNQQMLASSFRRVVLTAPIDVLKQRIGQDPNRPLWGANVEELYRSRIEAYLSADLIVDTSEMSVNEVAMEIVEWVRSLST